MTNDVNPQLMLSGDSNFQVGGVPLRPGLRSIGTNDPVAWMATRHINSGNIGLADGSVVPYLGARALDGVIDPASGRAMPADSDSLILAQKMEYYPITKTIFELFQLVGVGRYLAAALGTWAMAFLAVTIVGSIKFTKTA